MSDVEMNIITVGSVFEETPEGLFRMGRIQRNYDELMASLDPEVREIVERVSVDIERAFLGL